MTTCNTYKGYVAKLNEYRKLYSDPIALSNIEEYNRLYAEVVKYEHENPSRILPESPTQEQNKVNHEFKKAAHYTPMHSLRSTSEKKDLEQYWLSFSDIRNAKGVKYIDNYYCDYKLDGVPIELWYRDRKLICALTRGDGMFGEDITENVRHISSVPQVICYSKLVVVRGSVIVHRWDYDLANRAQRLREAPEFTSMEHYINYSLHLPEPAATGKCNLKFYAWDAITSDVNDIPYHAGMMTTIASQFGFTIPEFAVCNSVEEILRFASETQRRRESLPYNVSGIVIKQNNRIAAKRMGFDEHHFPVFDIVYKFAQHRNDTVIKSIKWKMGRTGRLSPFAIIEPLEIEEGVRIKEIKLDNAANVESRGLGVGAVITIGRVAGGGAKLNNVLKPVTAKIPQKCPYCGGETRKVGTDLRCTNHDCLEKLSAGLQYLLGRDVLNIPGITDEMIVEMIASGTITKLTDIFTPLESKSKAIPQELLDDLVRIARNISMSDLIVALNIPRLTKMMSLQFTSELVKNIDDFIALMDDPEKLKWGLQIPPSIKADVVNWCHDSRNIKLLNELKALNLPNCS
jgi:DNA ligase (NAD+)